jgi:hypothetical protein
MQATVGHIGIVQVDKAGEQFIAMGAPTAIPILMPGIRGAAGQL